MNKHQGVSSAFSANCIKHTYQMAKILGLVLCDTMRYETVASILANDSAAFI